MRCIAFVICLCLLTGCADNNGQTISQSEEPFVVVLGTTQDAGSPQAGCLKECCTDLNLQQKEIRKVVCLGIVDPHSGQTFMMEATPDFPSQLELLQQAANSTDAPNGIFVTHAHIGHYTGLMYLGKEAMGSSNVPVYCLPRMKSFLETNGPWNNLVLEERISLKELSTESSVKLTNDISIRTLKVPHRDEYSETAGFVIQGPSKKVLFIPDIDKWTKWETDIAELVKQVDMALLDATFYDSNELPGRNMDEIPHPFVVESIAHFESLPPEDKAKIHFIHFNHTNPLLTNGDEAEAVRNKGYNLAVFKQSFHL